MAGTPEGGRTAAKTNKERHGKNFYANIGRKGGKKGHTGGFASEKVGKDGLTGFERAAIAGKKGGEISKRGKKKALKPSKDKEMIRDMILAEIRRLQENEEDAKYLKRISW